MTKKIKIFVAHHKPGLIYEDDIFIPIHVWKKNSKYDLWIIWDDTWDNISDKNPGFCELTAQYRVWKNYDLSNVDYVWFCHYRRYMNFNYKPQPYSPLNVFKKDVNLYRKLIDLLYYLLWVEYQLPFNKETIKEASTRTKKFILNSDFDIITPKKTLVIHRPFYHLGIENDKAWKIMENILIDKYPWYYKVLDNMKYNLKCSFANMYIMKKDLFLEYANWQFWLLIEFEKQIIENWMSNDAISNGNRGINTRVMWFISERFPCIFAEYQKSKWKKINHTWNLIYLY